MKMTNLKAKRFLSKAHRNQLQKEAEKGDLEKSCRL